MRDAKQFRRVLKAYSKDQHAISAPPELWSEWLKIDPDLFSGSESATYRQAARNHNRLLDWGVTKDKSELMDALARLAWDITHLKSQRRMASSSVEVFRRRYRDVKKKNINLRSGSVRGGRNRYKNDPSYAAKVAAQELWTLAKFEGWTAPKYLLELELRGHEASLSAVSRWLTALRKGESLLGN